MSEIKNLLTETIDVLNEHGKTERDILWVGSHNEYTHENTCTNWSEFAKKANYEYNNGCGINVNNTLVVVGRDFWLERHRHDKAEQWEYKTLPNINDYNSGDIDLWSLMWCLENLDKWYYGL